MLLISLITLCFQGYDLCTSQSEGEKLLQDIPVSAVQ